MYFSAEMIENLKKMKPVKVALFLPYEVDEVLSRLSWEGHRDTIRPTQRLHNRKIVVVYDQKLWYWNGQSFVPTNPHSDVHERLSMNGIAVVGDYFKTIETYQPKVTAQMKREGKAKPERAYAGRLLAKTENAFMSKPAFKLSDTADVMTPTLTLELHDTDVNRKPIIVSRSRFVLHRPYNVRDGIDHQQDTDFHVVKFDNDFLEQVADNHPFRFEDGQVVANN